VEPSTVTPVADPPQLVAHHRPGGLRDVRVEFPILAREFDGRSLVYLDSAATAQKPAYVLDAMDDFQRNRYGTIHRGIYTLAEEATAEFEGARERIARWIGATPKETIFTGNATQAINLVAYAWGRANVGEGDRIVLTQMEHHSNIVPWQILAEERGATIDWAPVDDQGRIDLDALDALLARDPKLLGLVHVSNVLGTVNPVAGIVARARAAGVTTMVDGTQAAPHMSIDMREVGADFYALTAHKLYGPTGIGVLYGRRELLETMPPFIGGGHMIKTVEDQRSTWNDLPHKFEAGTSAISEAVGFGAAVDWLEGLGMDAVRAHEADLMGYGLERLAEVPGLTVFGPREVADRGAVISFALAGTHPHDVAEILARDAVCVRAGHHCTQPLMRRLGVAATTRASFAVHSTRDDVDRLVEGLHEVRRVFALD
jgi:cysteine desulfurase/selenocysteine lyase